MKIIVWRRKGHETHKHTDNSRDAAVIGTQGRSTCKENKKRRTRPSYKDWGWLFWEWRLCLELDASQLVEPLSHFWLFETPWAAAHQASLSSTVSQWRLTSQTHAQTHVHWVGDAIQPRHPLFCLHLSQPSGSFPIVGSSHQVAKVLQLQLQYLAFQWIFRVHFLSDWLVWSPCCARDCQESSTTIQKHQFFST